VWLPLASAPSVAGGIVAVTAAGSDGKLPVIAVPAPFAPTLSMKYSAAATLVAPVVASLTEAIRTPDVVSSATALVIGPTVSPVVVPFGAASMKASIPPKPDPPLLLSVSAAS
jgi:hypothetical protein